MKPKTVNLYQDIILNSINEGVFTVDADWRITSFNRAAEKITGVKREHAIGRFCKNVFRADICEDNCALQYTLKTGRPVTNARTCIVNSNGKRVVIQNSTAILKDPDGTIVGGVETFQDLSQVEQLRKELEETYTFEDIIGQSKSMRSIFRVLPKVSESDSTVLIEGASGTGKELFARAIHNLSNRKSSRFVAINCAAFPDTLLESELFGYKAGAFTDAKKDKIGRLAYATGGTVFLDEIAETSPAMQVRLLRVLQERTIEPLGGVNPVKINVRIIAATNKDLAEQVQRGAFRKDLYYRIRIIHLKLPRLRERRVDIPLLVDHLVAKFNRIQGKDIVGVSEKVLAILMRYHYPGNVRELENIIEQSFVLCNGNVIDTEHLPVELQPSDTPETMKVKGQSDLKAMEAVHISEALMRYKGNRGNAAKALGIHPSTLYRKMKKFNIETPFNDGRHRGN